MPEMRKYTTSALKKLNSLVLVTVLLSGQLMVFAPVASADGHEAITTVAQSPETAQLTIKKVLVPESDPGLFNLYVDGGAPVVEDASNGSVGSKDVAFGGGSWIVKEQSANDATNLEDYTTAVVCTNQNAAVVKQSAPSGKYSRSATVPDDNSQIYAGDKIECVFTNTRKTETLVVKKEIISEYGGTNDPSDFSFRVDGGEPVQFEADGANEIELSIGETHSIKEVEADGYETAYNGCDGFQVNVERTVECVITNTALPAQVNVQKILVTGEGSTAKFTDFEVMVRKHDAKSFDADGVAEFKELSAGEYEVKETPVKGFKTEYSEGCKGVLSVGESVDCTITNTELAQVTLHKKVINNNGGRKKAEDFVLSVDSDTDKDFAGGAESGEAIYLNEGAYVFGELADKSYKSLGWTEDSACTNEGLLSVVLSAVYECTLVNDDKPGRIVVHKKVVNDNGGTKSAKDFNVTVDGKTKKFNIKGKAVFKVDANNYDDTEAYTVHENYSKEYNAEYSKGCEGIRVANGQTRHCYITNDDVAPVVHVSKDAYPYYTDQTFDFKLSNSNMESPVEFTLNGDMYSEGNSFRTDDEFQAGVVDLSEAPTEGWELVGMYCEMHSYYIEDSSYGYYSLPLEVEVGDEYYCTVENVQNGEVTATKFHDINENGEWDEDEPTLSDWEINVTEVPFCDLVAAELISVAKVVPDELLVAEEMVPVCERENLDFEPYSESRDTDDNGEAVFANVPGFGLYEISETLQDGWVQSALTCQFEHDDEVRLLEDTVKKEMPAFRRVERFRDNIFPAYPGAKIECHVGNHRLPEIEIEKSNDAAGPVNPGATVEFTLEVTVPEPSQSGIVRGTTDGPDYLPVTVTDFLQDEFSYVAGSFSAESSVRGDLVGLGITTDPDYQSPGTWVLTSLASNKLVPGEVIKLVYTAVVDADTKTGTYPTEASVIGYGADVDVTAKDSDDDSVVVFVPQVLGTSTPSLVQTGQDFRLAILVATALVATGLILSRNKLIVKTRG